MNKTDKLVSKKILSVFLSVLLIFSAIPTGAFTVLAGIGSKYGKYESVTTGVDVSSSNDENIDVIFSDSVLSWEQADSTIGKIKDGWYIETKMTAPSNFTAENDFIVDNKDVVTYTVNVNGNISEEKSFWNMQSTDINDENAKRTVSLYAYVNEQMLNEAVKGSAQFYEYKFNWNGDVQTLKLNILPSIKLTKNSVDVYPSSDNGTVSALSTSFNVINEKSNYVTVENTAAVTVDYDNGYKIGLNVEAPSNMVDKDDFQGVTYQAYNGSVWQEACNFWDNQIIDKNADNINRSVVVFANTSEDELNLAKLNNQNLHYYFRFDFNNDNVYEQYVDLEVNPSNVTLTKDGYQIYPKLGSVTAVDGAQVQGSGTGNVTVTATDLQLDYKKANSASGIDADGWWTSIVVNTADLELSALENAKYQVKEYAADSWSEVKSFWDNKISSEIDSSYFIKFNVMLNNNILNNAEQSGSNITYSYQFDWNNDGVFEQVVTYIIVPSEKIVLNKLEQTGFKFENESPLDQEVGAKFINVASGGQGSGQVTYSIKSGSEYATIDSETGEITFNNAGKVTVTATKAADDVYDEATAEYTISSYKIGQSSFKFETTGPVTLEYGENKKYTNSAIGGSGNGEITYSIIGDNKVATIDSKTGEISILKAGEVVVEAKKASDNKYLETNATFTLIIKKTNQDELSFTTFPLNNEVKYMTTEQPNILKATGGSGNGSIIYTVVSGTDVASISSTGAVTTFKPGQFTVKAIKEGDDCYNQSQEIQITLTVVKGEQDDLLFEQTNPDSITFNTNDNKFVNKANGGSGNGEISYSVVSGSEYATVDSDGVVEFTKSGLIKVCATKAADDYYTEKKAYYEITVNKAEQDFEFEDGIDVTKYYGTRSYKNNIKYNEQTTLPDGKGYGVGDIVYTVSTNNIGASVDSDGQISFNNSSDKVGKITVTATKQEDDCYNSCTKSYDLTIEYIQSPSSDDFSFTGEKIDDTSDWYTGNVIIHAPDGYKVSYSNNFDTENWTSSVDYNTEGTTKANLYLMDKDGYITDKIQTSDIKIDETNPNIEINYSASIGSKLLELINYKAYKSSVTVTVKANNNTSSIDKLIYNYNGEDIEVDSDNLFYDRNGKASCQFTVLPQYRDRVSASAIAESGRRSDMTDSQNVIVVDDRDPIISVNYEYKTNQPNNEYNDVIYTNDNVNVSVKVEDSNIDISDNPVVKINNNIQEIVWNKTDNKLVGNFTLNKDGNNHINVSFKDLSGNSTSYDSDVFISRNSPQFIVTYDNSSLNNCYKNNRTATVKVTASTFNFENIDFNVTAKDIFGDDIQLIDYSNYLKDIDNWKLNDNYYETTVTFDTDANYSIVCNYTDLSGNSIDEFSDSFTVDHKAPVNVNVEYSTPIISKVIEKLTFGYYQAPMEVILTAEDDISGVDYFEYSYTKQDGASDVNTDSYEKTITTDEITYSENGSKATAKFEVPAQARGYIGYSATDRAGNSSEKAVDENQINIVDNISPERTVEFSAARIIDEDTMLDVDSYEEKDHDHIRLMYKENATVTFKVTEANFYTEDVDIKVNGQNKTVDWTNSGDEWTGVLTIEGEGDYVVTMDYKDRSNNEMKSYTSPKIAIDDTKPEINVEYTDENGNALSPTNYKYYKTDVYAHITLTEHNFRADDVVAEITAKDVTEKDVETQKVDELKNELKTRENWTTQGDVHTITVKFDKDAQYTFTLDYTDLVGNKAEQYVAKDFVVDHNAPVNVNIEYSTPIISKVIEELTFGYYRAPMEVTLTAEDDISGVDYFKYSYTKQDGASDVNTDSYEETITTDEITYSENGSKATAKFEVPAQARGYIGYSATDRAGNSSEKAVDENQINIVDNIDPTRKIEYSTPEQIVDANNLDKLDSYEENTEAILYYDDEFTATLKINEANFYAEDVVVTENGKSLGILNWSKAGDGDEWTTQFTVSEEGDHIVEVTYKDRSDNEMKSYTSPLLVIDKTAPVVSVEYPNYRPVETNSDRENNTRDYLDKTQKSIITIKEHNFRADDVVIKVNAWDSKGNNVNSFSFDAFDYVKEYQSQGKSRDNWTAYNEDLSSTGKWRRSDDTYKLELSYNNDANYTFDIEYKDLALRDCNGGLKKYFTVDTVKPTVPNIEYSETVVDKVIQTLSFGYYQPMVTTTVTASDTTSGVSRFKWNYTKQPGTSDVNAETSQVETITARNIRYTNDGATATVQFDVPANARGYISAQVLDWSDNSNDYVDSDRINVVDNIKPTINVTYNSPVKSVNGIDYYAGDIEGRIEINEANFYSDDVVVSATRNNSNVPVSVNWTDESVDKHIGTFTFKDDGDYIVSVDYTDRSNNRMDSYKSNQLTRDTQVPVINVSNIVSNSANKDEKYGFTITATDTNIDSSSFVPTLDAVFRNEDGDFVHEQVNLGEMATVESGKTYSFTVDDLPNDALYTLHTTVKDYAEHTVNQFSLQDGRTYDDVQFSINRHGSFFVVDEPTSKVINQYYINKLNNNIVVKEINVDPIENYTVKLNGNVLNEDTDYITTQSSNTDEWSIRTYSINSSLFEDEGEYTVTVESVDKTETAAYSDVKNLDVSFIVDKTAPILTITGLESNGRYQVDEQEVTLIPTDDGGRLNSLQVFVYDSNGNPKKDSNGNDISERFNMSGDEFIEYLNENDGKVTFTVPNGLENKVQIICKDCAVDENGKENEYNETFEKVTVSQSSWIIFYANKPLFYGTIIGILAVIAAIVGIIIFIKRKKNSKSDTESMSD